MIRELSRTFEADCCGAKHKVIVTRKPSFHWSHHTSQEILAMRVASKLANNNNLYPCLIPLNNHMSGWQMNILKTKRAKLKWSEPIRTIETRLLSAAMPSWLTLEPINPRWNNPVPFVSSDADLKRSYPIKAWDTKLPITKGFPAIHKHGLFQVDRCIGIRVLSTKQVSSGTFHKVVMLVPMKTTWAVRVCKVLVVNGTPTLLEGKAFYKP